MGKTSVDILTIPRCRGYFDDAMGRSDLRCVSLPGITLREAKKRSGAKATLLLIRHLAVYDPSCIYSYASLPIYKSWRRYNASLPNPRARCIDN